MFSGRAVKFSPFWPPGMPVLSIRSFMTWPHLFLSLHRISLLANTAGWFWYVRVVPPVVLLGVNGFLVCCLGWLLVQFACLGAAATGASVGHLWAGSHCSGMPSTSMGSLTKMKLRNDLYHCVTCEDPLHTGPQHYSLDKTGMQQSCCIGDFGEPAC